MSFGTLSLWAPNVSGYSSVAILAQVQMPEIGICVGPVCPRAGGIQPTPRIILKQVDETTTLDVRSLAAEFGYDLVRSDADDVAGFAAFFDNDISLISRQEEEAHALHVAEQQWQPLPVEPKKPGKQPRPPTQPPPPQPAAALEFPLSDTPVQLQRRQKTATQQQQQQFQIEQDDLQGERRRRVRSRSRSRSRRRKR